MNSGMTAYEQLNSLIPVRAWESSVCLVIIYGKEIHPFGTGTLLKIADDAFIVTAAHVIRQAHELDKSLAVATGKSFTALFGNWSCTSDNGPFDLAVLRLSPDVTRKLKAISFIRLQDIDFDVDMSQGVFCLLGYPGKLSVASTPDNVTMRLRPFQIVTYAHREATKTLSGYQEEYHLLLDGNDKGWDINGQPTRFCDRNGNPLEYPKELGGISGCSVWKIGRLDKPISDWSKYRPKVVAVQTGVYSDSQTIKTTRWIGVSTLIYEAYPDLRPALKLRYVEY